MAQLPIRARSSVASRFRKGLSVAGPLTATPLFVGLVRHEKPPIRHSGPLYSRPHGFVQSNVIPLRLTVPGIGRRCGPSDTPMNSLRLQLRFLLPLVLTLIATAYLVLPLMD